MTFAGFPARPQSTAIPNVFFSDLLPRLGDDAAALGVTLYALHVLSRKKGFPRYVTAADLQAEPGLASYLITAQAGGDAIEAGMARACALGVFLPLRVETGADTAALYFLNAPADRRGMETVRANSVELAVPVRPVADTGRLSIFSLYESLVGTISPLIANELAEAERLYPQEWLEAAFREAAAQNARSWRYVSRILERWAVEGPDHAKTERDPAGAERYLSGKYGSIVRRRLNS